MSIELSERTSLDGNSDHGRVYNWLKAAAIDFRFRPGEQIMIGELADRLRVSSTPVRETLIRLQAESLLETAPRRGFFAKTLNLREMTELVQLWFLILRSSLEQAGDITASGAVSTPGSSDPGRAAVHDGGSIVSGANRGLLDQPIDVVQRVDELAGAILALCRNDVMLRSLRNVNDRTRYVRMIDVEANDRMSEIRSMLQDLPSALHQNDVIAAIAILRKYRDDIIERMPALIKEGIGRAYTSPSWILPSAQSEAGRPAPKKVPLVNRPMYPRR